MTVERSPGGRLTNRAAPGGKKIDLSNLSEMPDALAALNRTASEIRQRINDHLSLWLQYAKDAQAEAAARRKKSAMNNKLGRDAKPAEADEAATVLDLELAATHVAREIRRVRAHLMQIERTFAEGHAPSLAGVHFLLEAALLLGIRSHQLTIVNNESAITDAAKRLAILAKNREAASAKAEQGHRSLKRQADVIRKAHPDWMDSAVMRKMIKDDPANPALKNRSKPDTVRRIIKNPNKQKRRSSK
jgi:hypothetical protein